MKDGILASWNLNEKRVEREFGVNYDAWRLPVLKTQEFEKLTDKERVLYLVSLGHLAASTHNTQPWEFRIEDEGRKIEIYLDKERVLPASDVEGRQAVVSVGCAVGNIMTAATRYGISVELENVDVEIGLVKPVELGGSDGHVKLVSIELGEMGKEQAGLVGVVGAMTTRRVERREHDRGRDFEDVLYKKMGLLFEGEDKLGLVLWRRGDIRIKGLAEMQAFADSFVANNEEFSVELGEWFVKNNVSTGLGMPGGTFGLSDDKTNEVVAGLSGEEEMEADTLAGFSQAGKRGIESAAMVGMLTVDEQSLKSWMQVGMRLSMIANMVEEAGGGLAVHAGLAEVPAVRMGLAGIGMTRQKPVVLFRAGLRRDGEERLPHSPRLSIDEVII